MVRGAFHRVAAIPLVAIAIAGCSGNSPGAPAPSPPSTTQTPVAVRAAIDVTGISVAGERATGGGYRYRVVVALRETAGVAARVDAVDLTFTKGADVLATSRFDQPLVAVGSTVAGRDAAVTRELVTTDANSAHAFATGVSARVSFTDPSDAPSTATGTADVPPLSDAAAILYTLAGVITDQTTGTGIAGARVEAMSGVNRGKATTTDPSGAYALTGLLEDGFRMRASAIGFDVGEQNVTVPVIARADMALRRSGPSPGACAYSVTPIAILGLPFTGGQGSISITQSSGTCGWQAKTDASWLTLASSAGSGSATLPVTASPNGSFNTRTAAITVEWTGGQARIAVVQGTPPDTCQVMLTVNGQNAIAVPASGGQYTATAALAPGVAPFFCGIWSITSTAAASGISVGSVGNAVVTFTVAANSTSNVRSLFVEATIKYSGTTAGELRPRVIVNQAGVP
jgi:Carboxypeptidase regulatory-like domain/Putative binding domain, N-terminal